MKNILLIMLLCLSFGIEVRQQIPIPIPSDILSSNILTNNYSRQVQFGSSISNSIILSDGTIIATGSATCWEDANISGLSLGAGASAPDQATLTGNILIRAFDGNSTTEQLYGGLELPHSWKVGTEVEWHIHLVPLTNDSGTVNFYVDYSHADTAETRYYNNITTVSGSIYISANTQNKSYYMDLGGMQPVSGWTLGEQLVFRVYRVPTGTDTFAGDVGASTIGIHYQRDMLGSREERIKY